MTGTLTKVDWQNPHVYFYVDLKEADNQVASWSFEAVSVAYLKRSGIQRQDFDDNFGKMVTVRACLGKKRQRVKGPPLRRSRCRMAAR